RLGQRERADLLALGDLAHVLLLLRLGAVGQDAVAEQRVVDRHDGGARGVGRGDLDHGQHVGHRVHARAAVLGRHLDAHQSVLAEHPDVVEWELAGAVVVFGTGGDHLLADATRHVLDHQLLFGETEIHAATLAGHNRTAIVAGRRAEATPVLTRRRNRQRLISLNRDGKIFMDLEGWSNRLKVFADATRVRLLALLEGEELTVAELSAITRLAQPRVSTHLAKLKEAGLVRDRRAGVSAYYRFDEAALDPAQRALWHSIS